MAACRLHVVCDAGAVSDVRGGDHGGARFAACVRRDGCAGGRGGVDFQYPRSSFAGAVAGDHRRGDGGRMQGAFAGFFCDASVIFFSVAGMVRLCYDIFKDGLRYV